jgi:hypothetical protein
MDELETNLRIKYRSWNNNYLVLLKPLHYLFAEA